MFSRFSPASRRVLRAAEQECRNHNHYYVGSEHLLLALLEEHDSAVMQRLTISQVSSADVHAELRRSLGTGDDRTWEGILVTPRVRKIVDIAGRRAEDEASIEPIDLLEAIVTEGGGLAAAVLTRVGASRLQGA